MKIAVGIIGLALSMIALLQSCAITGLSGLANDQAVGEAGAMGMVTAFLMFFGGAFSFGLPGVARVLFALGFLASIPARESYPDMWVWGIASAGLGGLLLFVKSTKKDSKSTEQ
jgi:hypothetical protein